MRSRIDYWAHHRPAEMAAVITIAIGLLVFWLTGEWGPL